MARSLHVDVCESHSAGKEQNEEYAGGYLLSFGVRDARKAVVRGKTWGKRSVEDEDEDDDDDEDEDEEEWEDASVDGSVVYVIDEDEDNDSTSSDSRCPCNFQATRWSGTLNAERVVIWEPRPRTRNCPLPPALQHPHLHKRHKTRLLSNIFHCAGSTADTLVAALDIHIAADSPSQIISLLDSHSTSMRRRPLRRIDLPTPRTCHPRKRTPGQLAGDIHNHPRCVR